MTTVRLGTPAGDTIACHVAAGVWSRMMGYMGRSAPPPNEGLLITPCRSVHTAFMRFSCDVVFLGSGGRVLRVAANTPPWRIRRAPWGTRSVVELAGSEAARCGLLPGALAKPLDERAESGLVLT